MSKSDEKSKPLEERLHEWLDEEGYPLEFSTANVFREAGFHVRQGSYVRGGDSEAPRELDVTASIDSSHDALIRVYHVIECKWSQNKPWVVFTGNHRMGPPACVTQTMSSILGSAMLWKDAGLDSLHKLDLFATPPRAGFNGRQAFTKGADHFYNSMKSVTSVTKQLLEYYDDDHRPVGAMPRNAVVAFPVIVVDGQLFETHYNRSEDRIALSETDCVRCHWKGAPAWRLHATIDIVTLKSLPSFVERRRAEVDSLLSVLEAAHGEIAECFSSRSIDNLTVTKGSRGVVGLHRLFRELRDDTKRIEGPPERTSS